MTLNDIIEAWNAQADEHNQWEHLGVDEAVEFTLRHVDAFVSCEEIQKLCDLTVQLTELRQNECKHLSIEEFAPDIFHKLLSTLIMTKRYQMVEYSGKNVLVDITSC